MEAIKKKLRFSGTDFYIYKLSSGIKCYIIPKDGFKTKEAMAVVNFGSADSSFKLNSQEISLPAGMAHFIEHKLFDKKDRSFFNDLSANGAYVNAFTDFNKTAYYFSCQSGFYDNLDMLMEMISKPYFDNDGVENEKNIIKSEISMYNDNPQRAVFSNLLKIMYPKSPLSHEVAGSHESVDKIKASDLYKCYEAFYTPNNISIICCGDIEPELAALTVQKAEFGDINSVLKTPYSRMPERDYISKNMGLSEPIFNIGFKYDGIFPPEKIYALKMIFELICGKGSKLYERLLNKQIITEPLVFDIINTSCGSFGVISGKGPKPAYVANSIIKTAQLLSMDSIPEYAFKRVKKAFLGGVYGCFNSIDSICMTQAELSNFGFDLTHIENALENLSLNSVNGMAKTAFVRDRAFLSIIK